MTTDDCPNCAKPCTIGPHRSAHCSACFTSFIVRCQCGTRHLAETPCATPMGAVRGCWPLKPCTRCGQMSDAASVCATCRDADREPQGAEAMRLFAPAPNQITGQMSL